MRNFLSPSEESGNNHYMVVLSMMKAKCCHGNRAQIVGEESLAGIEKKRGIS